MIARDLQALCMAVLMAVSAGSAAAAKGLDAAKLRKVRSLAKRFDANGNGALDPAERTKLAARVAKEHGPGGAAVLETALAAADTDADGTITRAEWAALAKRVAKAPKRFSKKTVMLAMSDGVKLATDVYLPRAKGPFPVILSRTPYGRSRRAGGAMTAAGYAVVVQDMRGRFDSQGENIPFIGCGWAKHRDGAETVAWILRQPWCAGKVGTLGGSAGGITQNLLAGAAPKGLAAQHISVAAASLYHHAAYVGGALRKSQVETWLTRNRFDRKALRLFRAHPSYDAYWHDYERFCDVYPDGRSFLMAEGMLRLRYRNSPAKPEPLKPGEIYEVDVDCWSTSVVVNTGHRIRVSVTSSNYPRFDVNPGTGRPGGRRARPVRQTNRIYCDAKYPSRIILPVVAPKKPAAAPKP